jgi:hypothetical protein
VGIARWRSGTRRAHKEKPRPTSRCLRVDGVGRGRAKIAFDCNREPGFFVIAVEKVFSFRPDWHQDRQAQPLVRHYQAVLDAVLESHPQLGPCVAGCAYCGIRFLSDRRNAGRRDLRCPFGCRRHHRQRSSSQRSVAYYRTPVGKLKKQRLNARRDATTDHQRQPDPQQPSSLSQEPPPSVSDHGFPAELSLDGVLLDEPSLLASPMLPYVRMVASLVDGMPLSLAEVVGLLRQALRQHSMARRRRLDYLLHVLGRQHRYPP